MEGITVQLLMLQVVTGIALGSIYALLAIGLSLIFGMLTIVNFAHGAFFMVGAFLAGVLLAVEAFRQLDPRVTVRVDVPDGAAVPEGMPVLFLSGHARGILSAERVALNFLQRLSGVATLTAKYVQAVAGTGARILDTRTAAGGTPSSIAFITGTPQQTQSATSARRLCVLMCRLRSGERRLRCTYGQCGHCQVFAGTEAAVYAGAFRRWDARIIEDVHRDGEGDGVG